MATFLQRYSNGEHEQVWAELLAFGAAIREEPLLTEARAVASETMQRVRRNVEVIAARLQEIGYRYTTDPVQPPGLHDPPPNCAALLADLEQLVGPIPLSLEAWFTVVGAVNFMGTHPAWKLREGHVLPDPLVVFDLEGMLADAQERLNDPTWEEDGDPYLYLAPDEYIKEDISGGIYGILMQPAADAPLLFEWHETTFVHYLRRVFRWGGFPGFARYAEYPADHIHYLSEGLLPL